MKKYTLVYSCDFTTKEIEVDAPTAHEAEKKADAILDRQYEDVECLYVKA